MLKQGEILYIAFGGSTVERENLAETAQQISLLLEGRNIPHRIVDLGGPDGRGVHPNDFGMTPIYLLLDPFIHCGKSVCDYREVLEEEHVIFTGPSIRHSRPTSNKQLTKHLIRDARVNTIPGAVCATLDEVNEFLGSRPLGPTVLKPVDRGGGESVFFAATASKAVECARFLIQEYGQLLVESYISGMEVSCPIISVHGKIMPLPLVGIEIFGAPILDHAAKSTNSFRQLIPAPIEESSRGAIVDYSTKLYSTLSFEGLLRVDFIVGPAGPHFLEANSYPSLGRKYGISVPAAEFAGFGQFDVVRWLVESARLRAQPGKTK